MYFVPCLITAKELVKLIHAHMYLHSHVILHVRSETDT
jgi:hypothetical protein